MCGVAGFVRLRGGAESFLRFREYFKEVNLGIAQRGPDCFGMWGLQYNSGSEKNYRTSTAKDKIKYIPWTQVYDRFFGQLISPHIVLCNFRGIPTTEFNTNSPLKETIQPYLGYNDKFVITHNGQLNNDRELAANKGYPSMMTHAEGASTQDIDSYAFLHLMHELKSPTVKQRSTEFAKLIHSLEGSYAFAGVDLINQVLYFGRNFRGLYFALWEDAKETYLVWSSEEKSLNTLMSEPDVEICVREMPMDMVSALYFQPSMSRSVFTHTEKSTSLYYIMRRFLGNGAFLTDKKIDVEEKIRSKHNRESCAVVLSGGLDSTVCATWACDKYKEIHLLHFHYGARAEKREYEAVSQIYYELCQNYPTKEVYLKFIPLDFIKELGGSTLTDHAKDIAQGEQGVETDHEWVPARNMAFMGLALSYCDRHDIGNITLGLNMEEGSVYKDNSIEFYQQYEKASQLGSRSMPKMQMPLGNSMKHAIVAMGIKLKAPLHLVWSCYTDGMGSDGMRVVNDEILQINEPIRCGCCGPCVMSQRAFAMNGLLDPKDYQHRDIVAQEIFESKKGLLHAAGK